MQYWIMKYCLQTLIKGDDPVEENIESLCKLLTTVGKAMEQERHKENQDKERDFLEFVFARLKALSVDKRLSSRIRFMIQDVLDLRKNHWKPRKVEASAKKISDINKEAESEKRRREAEDKERARNSRMPASRGMQVEREKDVFKPTRGKDRYGSRTKTQTPTKNSSAADGWATASRGKQKGGRGVKESPRASNGAGGGTRSAASTPKSNKTQERGNNFRKDREKAPPKAKKSGFAALCDDSDDENDEADSANESANESVNDSANESGSANESASESDNDNDSSSRTRDGPKLSGDEAKRKIRSFFLEYFNALDKDEVKLCIQDLGTKEFNQEIVTMGIEEAIDGKPTYRQHLPTLFLYLYEEKILSSDNFILGLGDILSGLVDMLCDMPKATEYLAAILTPLILEKIIPLGYLLGSEMEAFEMGAERAKLVEFIVKEVAQTKSVDFLKKMDIRDLPKVAQGRSSLAQWLNDQGV